MASSINKVILLGNLTRDPESRTIASGQPFTSFGMATNRSYTTATGEKKEQKDFHTVIMWGRLAELCALHLKKGKKVYVDGRMQTREWEEEGEKRFRTEVVAENVVFLDKPEKPPVEDLNVADIVF